MYLYIMYCITDRARVNWLEGINVSHSTLRTPNDARHHRITHFAAFTSAICFDCLEIRFFFFSSLFDQNHWIVRRSLSKQWGKKTKNWSFGRNSTAKLSMKSVCNTCKLAVLTGEKKCCRPLFTQTMKPSFWNRLANDLKLSEFEKKFMHAPSLFGCRLTKPA